MAQNFKERHNLTVQQSSGESVNMSKVNMYDVQELDQGIIRSFKENYRKDLLNNYWKLIKANKETKEVDVLFAFMLILDAWRIAPMAQCQFENDQQLLPKGSTWHSCQQTRL